MQVLQNRRNLVITMSSHALQIGSTDNNSENSLKKDSSFSQKAQVETFQLLFLLSTLATNDVVPHSDSFGHFETLVSSSGSV